MFEFQYDLRLLNPASETGGSSAESTLTQVARCGDRREPIFKDDSNRARFLETLGQCCTKTDWQVHAWCLMNNPFTW